MMKQNIIFGIDVSSKSSTVCVVIDRIKQGETFKITNDSFGYQDLLDRLNQYLITPLVVFEATGVYSLSLQAFLEDYHIKYLKLNPLKAKKLMDNNLRHNKTDKVDAYRLALIQFNAPQKLRAPQPKEYHELQNASRYYEELTQALIINKNQLHRNLQSTFPQIESILSTSSGRVYWTIVSLFPHAQYVLNHNENQVFQSLLAISGIGRQRAHYLTTRLYALARQAYPYDNESSITIRAIQRNIANLLSLSAERDNVINYMEKLAMQANARSLTIYESIPGIAKTTAVRLVAELGDLRRFDTSAQIDAFVGIDPGRYQSGEKDSHLGITKHGNHLARKILYRTITQMETVKATQPCHITDYYDKKKRSSNSPGYKKIAIASVHKLIRTMFALIKHDQLYDYNVATHNQRL
ncbi:IS110-like element ISLhe4 family transposase [Lactobacillus amylovorus]|uniref:IS110-like element ISLhe4 family transposase n=1 Tax=Lactobacillus amylovorus TaxID=1604 RepID=A0A5B8EDF4_LACAM|nr:IS110-like element ISLhe4 family transposase [Lactobacillus amylovorus]QDD69686.1 IS110-like element ISLhe4 family transposase [Lactobacillus amylovorus]QDD70704.1 IS110-like element ISLhe4 family transposase [Lactobacillus amylovorus]QDD70941.1 IS110-like element ISLhe4 family transposase [Lactobacillus amylovorus]